MVPESNGEGIQILKYENGQKYEVRVALLCLSDPCDPAGGPWPLRASTLQKRCKKKKERRSQSLCAL